ncbi:MAG: glycosyltransferase [Pseudomonadota bacterium]
MRRIALAVLVDRPLGDDVDAMPQALAEAIAGYADPADTVIVSLAGNATDRIDSREIDGVRTITLPEQAPWPYQRLSLRAYRGWRRRGAVGERLLERHRAQSFDAFWRLSSQERQSLREQNGLEVVLGHATAAVAARDGLPPRDSGTSTTVPLLPPTTIQGGIQDDRQVYSGGFSSRALTDVFRHLDVDLVFADGFRPIMLSAQVEASRSVASVSDNRFTCARFDHSRVVRGQPCDRCAFSCAAIDAPERVELLQRILMSNADHRSRRLFEHDVVTAQSGYLSDRVVRDHGARARSVLVDEAMPMAAAVPSVVDPLMRGVPQDVGFNIAVLPPLAPNRGQMTFLRASIPYLLTHADAVLHFIGRAASIEARMRAVALEHGVGERVHFHGRATATSVVEMARRAQVVVFPGRWVEATAVSLEWAELAGRPIVGFALGGIGERLERQRNEFPQHQLLSPAFDYPALFQSIEQLRCDPTLRHQMGESMRSAARARTGEGERGTHDLAARLIDLWQNAGKAG